MKLARLKEWRESHGLTQKELAARAHASEWTVTRAEAGEEVRPNTARRLAEVMGVTVADLLESPPVALKAEAPKGAGQKDIPDSLAELLERRGTATRHLADAHLSDAMDAASLDDARRIAREVRDEYTIVLEELGRLEERFPQAVTKIAGLLSRAVQQFMIARFSLYAKAGARFVPVNEVQVERVDKDRVRILPSEADEARSEDLREAQARELEDFQKALQQGQEKLAQLAGAHA